VPEILRTPGYPLLLIPGLLLDRLELVTISLQIMLTCLTMYMVYRIAQLLFECENAAIVAAALFAIEPVSILCTSKVVTDTLFCAAGHGLAILSLKVFEGMPATGSAHFGHGSGCFGIRAIDRVLFAPDGRYGTVSVGSCE
jgi:Dolichyl-phosphate-mannose-protein mannosyltransferase